MAGERGILAFSRMAGRGKKDHPSGGTQKECLGNFQGLLPHVDGVLHPQSFQQTGYFQKSEKLVD